tara:strand:- start:101 stop:367 length:267 start_codon:yes stop_codon:yes gene_type:complete
MKITKGQLKRIIKEEKAKILAEQQMAPGPEVMQRLKDALMAVSLNRAINQGDKMLEAEIIEFVMDSSAADEDDVYRAMQTLATQLNLM